MLFHVHGHTKIREPLVKDSLGVTVVALDIFQHQFRVFENSQHSALHFRIEPVHPIGVLVAHLVQYHLGRVIPRSRISYGYRKTAFLYGRGVEIVVVESVRCGHIYDRLIVVSEEGSEPRSVQL